VLAHRSSVLVAVWLSCSEVFGCRTYPLRLGPGGTGMRTYASTNVLQVVYRPATPAAVVQLSTPLTRGRFQMTLQGGLMVGSRLVSKHPHAPSTACLSSTPVRILLPRVRRLYLTTLRINTPIIKHRSCCALAEPVALSIVSNITSKVGQ
jgi:hypothetical protein